MYRGNTPLLKNKYGYVTILHKVIPPSKEQPVKTYVNYLCLYDNTLTPKWFSRPFKLTNQPIEFVTVLQPLNETDILIGVTSNDDTPEIQVYDAECLLQMVNRNITI